MEFIFRHGWIMLIAVTIANYFILKPRTQKYIDQNPDLKIGYDKIFKAILIYGNIPWVIMAIGDLTAQTNSVFDYFNPKSFNPFVLTFHLVIGLFHSVKLLFNTPDFQALFTFISPLKW